MIGMLPNFIARRPHVPEHDFAGVVVDANGTEYENGQEVYGWIPLRLSYNTFISVPWLLTSCTNSSKDLLEAGHLLRICTPPFTSYST